VFIVEQSAIIGAIQSEKNIRQIIVIITDSRSTIMAAESRTPTKNLKTQTIRKLLDQKRPSYGSPVTREYEKADQAAKETLDEDIPTTEKIQKEDTKGMPRKEQEAIFRLRTGYTRATHVPKMERVCNTDLSIDHKLWECKETENQRTNMDMNKEQ
jgi:hypothetical protein